MNKENKNTRLLIIDDEADFRLAIKQSLSRRGYEVSEASGGKEALDIIRKELPEVVLLDQKMPEMSGIETLQAIREISETLPVIILTGHGDYHTAIAGIKLDIVDFIQKPVDIDQLSEHIRMLLSGERNGIMREPTIAEIMTPPDLYPHVYIDERMDIVLKAISDAYRKPVPQDSVYGQVRSALVYDREENFKGMIRFSDILQLLIPDFLRDSPYASFYTGMLLAQSKVFGTTTVSRLVQKQVFVEVDMPLMEGINLLVKHKLINIPVVQNDKLVGILRGRDIILCTARLAGVDL